MPIANTALRLFQSGLEVDATPGTAVPATSKMAVTDIVFTPTDVFHRPKLAKGLITRNPGNETVIARGTAFSIPETPVVYDQMHHYLAMAVKGDVAAAGAPSVYTWTFPRDILADPDINTRTLERRLSDGTNFIDNEWAYAFLSLLRFIYEADQPLRFSAEGFARRMQSSTLTAGQVFPTIEIPPTALAKVWIDSTWATLGTTLIEAQVLRAELAFMTGYAPKMSLDGRTDLDFTTILLNAANVGMDLKLRLLIKADSGQFATEKAAAVAGTLRAIRIKVTGTASRALTLDGLYKYNVPEIGTIGSEDGQDIAELDLVDATDATNLFSAEVVNATNAVA